MIMIEKRVLIAILCPICFILNIHSQATHSPYSMLGLGEIENKDYGRTAGMSDIGIGVRDFDYLNVINPAGISDLDSLKFIFDMSAAGKYSFFTQRGKTDNTINGNLKKVSIGLRLMPGWGVSVGLKPFSDAGYRIYNEVPVDGSTDTKAVYIEGGGGLYELYLSNGIKVTDNFSVGINIKYITGTLKQTEDQTEYLFEKDSHIFQFYNTFGIQYHNQGLTLGATYGYKQGVTMSNKTIVYDNQYNVIEERDGRSTDQFIPETFGVGFSHDSKKLIWGMDFRYQKWKGIESGISSTKIVDSYRINTGLGYSPGGNRYYRIDNQGIRTRGQIQAGASLSKSYIQVGGENAYNYSVSAGYSFPVSWNLLNISLEYGNSLLAPAGYIKESYFMVTFNCSIIDQWFIKRRFN